VRSGFLKLSDTLMDWLTTDDTLMDCSLSSSSSYSYSVNNIALLLFEANSSSLIKSRWLGSFVDSWKLPVFPASDSHGESHDI